MTKQELQQDLGIKTMGDAMVVLSELYNEILYIVNDDYTELVVREKYMSLCRVLIKHPNTTPPMKEEISNQLFELVRNNLLKFETP